jgi:RNase adapter protein RapZ
VRVVVVTGLSGGGKSTTLRALEDLDYFCVDNLPLPLVEPCLELLAGQAEGASGKVALGIDARQGALLASFRDTLARLRKHHQVEVLFLDADDDLLVRRYSETRRRHPLAGDDLRAGIVRERDLLRPLRENAEAFVDTTSLNVHQLKGIIQERYGRAEGGLSVTLLSFGFKHGLPAEADLVIDVRFMPNPYFVEALSALSGLDETVAGFVLASPEAQEFMDRTADYLAYTLPRYQREGKAYLTIAVGCTGGRHRSVAVVRELAKRLQDRWHLIVRHRDLERGGAA